MNLEEITEEGFLTRLGKRAGKLILPFSFPLVFSFSSCSKDNISGPGNETPKKEPVLSSSITNQQGVTSFIDNQTQELVPVKVQDSKTKAPINSVSIEYIDGEDFKTYLVEPNKNYFPAIFTYPHNSEKILDLGEVVAKAFINQVIQGEEEHKALYSWKSEVTNNWANYYYVKTISKDEVLELKEAEYAAFDLAAEIATLKINYNPIPEDYSLSDIIKFLDAKKYFKDGIVAERWDIYHIDWGRKLHNGKTIQFGADNFDMIPSNIPTLILYNPKVEGDKMNITWKGSDKTIYNLNYFYESQHFPQNDLTITQGSNPDKADLTYYYKVLRNNSVYIDWRSTAATDLGLSDLADGNYSIFVQVSDDVKNYSDVKSANFSLEGETQKESFNIFDYVILTEGSYWNYTNNYYANVIDRGVYDGKTIATVENPNSGEYWHITSEGIYLFGVNIGKTSSGDLFFKPSAKIGSSKTIIGQSFDTNFNIYSDLDYINKIGYGREDWEYYSFGNDVTVPAGTFRNCLLACEISDAEIKDFYSYHGYSFHYFAKGVGEVKFVDFKGNTYELKNYSVK